MGDKAAPLKSCQPGALYVRGRKVKLGQSVRGHKTCYIPLEAGNQTKSRVILLVGAHVAFEESVVSLGMWVPCLVRWKELIVSVS